jgi:hypothetical protein
VENDDRPEIDSFGRAGFLMAIFRAFTPGRRAIVAITPRSIRAVEDYIRWAEHEAPGHLPMAMDSLMHRMALVNQSEARKMAYGPYDPHERNPSQAWRTPGQGIRRISQAYYLGWRVKKVGTANYILFNSSREAYFIEYGIAEVGFGTRNVPSRRIRRPVRKLSLLKTLEFMKTTQAYHRVWVDIFRSRHAHGGFTQIIQSPAGGHARWEDASAHEAQGEIARITRPGSTSHSLGVRRVGNRYQIRRHNRGGGSYGGPLLGRRLP